MTKMRIDDGMGWDDVLYVKVLRAKYVVLRPACWEAE